jgi:hypothetical protein
LSHYVPLRQLWRYLTPKNLARRNKAKKLFRRIKIMLKHLLTFIVLLLAVSAFGLLFFPASMFAVVGIVSTDTTDFLLRVSGAGVVALIPSAWVARNSADSLLVRAVLIGLAIYMVLSSLVDWQAYLQTLVNQVSIPSIAFRVLLGLALLWLTFNDKLKNKFTEKKTE